MCSSDLLLKKGKAGFVLMARPQRCKNGEVKAGKGGVGVVVEEAAERDSVGCVLKTGAFKKG